eukprot:3344698-Pyramimonas_sp.AAC.1
MWIHPHVDKWPGWEYRAEGVIEERVRVELPLRGCVGADGGGGDFSSDVRLRRCGWGFAMWYNGGTMGTAWGPILGRDQTVPLAELGGLIQALKQTPGSATFVVDCAD